MDPVAVTLQPKTPERKPQGKQSSKALMLARRLSKYHPLVLCSVKNASPPIAGAKRKLLATMPPKREEDPLLEKLCDIAASTGVVTEKVFRATVKQFCHFHTERVNATSLDLSNAGISTFPDCLARRLTRVAHLNLQGNQFTSIPFTFETLASIGKIEWVDISNNPIKLDAHSKAGLKQLIERGIYFFTGGDEQKELTAFVEYYQLSLF